MEPVQWARVHLPGKKDNQIKHLDHVFKADRVDNIHDDYGYWLGLSSHRSNSDD
jgi:hypothetical protein